ncbi:HET-domain-containing protein [Apiospora arundinis]
MSHCWGAHMPLRLLSSNIDDMQVSIPVARLSQSFKDAIQVLQWLGLDYIWIDSLCIVQDSPADWQKESATMADVYSNSHCNIAATHAADGTHGCFVERDARLVEPLKVGVNWTQTPAVYYVAQKDYWETHVMDTPLNARAWVCQERYLAPRTLFFGGKQLFWECQCCSASETFSLGLPPGVERMVKSLEPNKGGAAIRRRENVPHAPELDAFALWGEIVHQFSKGQLTFAEDKLVAVSGLASRMHKHIQSDYLAGLWRKHLPHQLLWVVYDGERHAVYTAPSWSWASMSGRLEYGDYINDRSIVLEIQEAKTQLVNEASPFGKTKAGYIRAKGYIASAGVQLKRRFPDWDPSTLCINDKLIGVAYFDEDQTNEEIIHRALYYLPIQFNPAAEVHGIGRGIEGLICEAASPDSETEFKRVGRFSVIAETSYFGLFQAACRQHSTGSQEYVATEGWSREWGPQLEFTLV